MLESQDAAADATRFRRRRDRRLGRAHVRARGHAARRQQAQGRLLARLRARRRRSGHRVCDLPAAQSGEFLESVIAAASKRGNRGRRRGDRGRESERPSHLPVRLHGRARAARHLERGLGATRRAASCRSWTRRRSAAISAWRRPTSRPARGSRRCAWWCATATRSSRRSTAGAVPHILHMGHVVVAPPAAIRGDFGVRGADGGRSTG